MLMGGGESPVLSSLKHYSLLITHHPRPKDMQPRATIDASKLPDNAWDAHAPLWWGNLLLVFIETTSMALLFATYFYVRRNFYEWPPPRINADPAIIHPVPHLAAATVNTLLLGLSCIP